MRPVDGFVAGSRGSGPAIAERSAAASATVLAIGPAVSCECAIGMIPERLTRPTVGLIPTRPLAAEGQTIEPSVSVPTPTTARFAEMAAPVPELDPQGFRSRTYGFFTWPPRALHPLVDRVERKFAHSLRLVLPRSTTPAARRRSPMNASRAAMDPSRASDPAVVVMPSAVSVLSLMRIGMPWGGPRAPQ